MAITKSFVMLLVSMIIALGQLREAMGHLKSLELNEKIIYDCIDMYKQPSLSHPWLKNHKIQVKPSRSILNSRNQVRDNKGYKTNVECPQGTVPILRTKQEDFTNAEEFSKNHFKPLANTATQIGAGVQGYADGPLHGFEAEMSLSALSNVGNDQSSYAQAYVSDTNNNNGIQVGWMVNPSLFGDGRVWSYGSWQGKEEKGCFNLKCEGFVQVSNVPLSEPLVIDQSHTSLRVSLHQDKNTGHWWITRNDNVDLGYWPKELFETIGDGASIVGFEGAVQRSPSSKASPPMGDGRLPTGNIKDSAFFSNLKVRGPSYNVDDASKFNLQKTLTFNSCYNVIYNGGQGFVYGGPGGPAC